MFHRLRTGRVQKRKYYIYESHWADPEEVTTGPHVGQYENLFGDALRPAPGMVVETLKETVDETLFSRVFKLHNASEVDDTFSEALLLDYFFGDFPVVTAAFKSLVEELDPGVHQFVPCTFLWGDALERVDTPLYRFVCGRLVTLDTTGVVPWGMHSPQAKRFAFPKPDELRYLAMLSERPDCYAALLDFPLWAIQRQRAVSFISDPFLKEAKARELKGFEICTAKSARDVTSVPLGSATQPVHAKEVPTPAKPKKGVFGHFFRQ